MNWKRVRLAAPVALGLILTACSSAAGSAQSGAQAPGVSSKQINIGMEADLTNNTTIGLGGQYGVRMAVQEINAHGGINGRQLNLITEDSQGSADGGATAGRKLVEQDNAFVIINAASSDATLPVLPIVEQAQIPFLITAAADPRLIAPFNPWVFLGTGVPVPSLIGEYVNFVKYLNASTVAILVVNGAFANSESAALQPAFKNVGVRVQGVFVAPTGATDFTSQVQSIKQLNPDLVFAIGGGGPFIKQLRQAGVNSKIVAEASQTTPQLISLAGSAAEGVYSFWEYSSQMMDDANPPMATWIANFNKDFPNPGPGMPNYFVLEGYQDMYALSYAIQECGQSPTRACVDQKLDQLQNFVAGKNGRFSYATPTGVPISYSSTSHQGNRSVIPLIVQGGRYTILQGAPSTAPLTNTEVASPSPSPSPSHS